MEQATSQYLRFALEFGWEFKRYGTRRVAVGPLCPSRYMHSVPSKPQQALTWQNITLQKILICSQHIILISLRKHVYIILPYTPRSFKEILSFKTCQNILCKPIHSHTSKHVFYRYVQHFDTTCSVEKIYRQISVSWFRASYTSKWKHQLDATNVSIYFT